MRMPERVNAVSFADESLENAFRELESGKSEDRKLASFIRRAMGDLTKNPFCGIRIPSKLWPKEYAKKYRINNLRKYDLPNGWRLIYTLRASEIEIISVLLEWFNHNDYERKFHY